MFNVFDLIFPKYCLECKKSGQYLCQDCLAKLPGLRKKNGVFLVFPYKGVIRKAIWNLKYRFAYHIAEELSDLVVQSLIKNKLIFPKNTLLVPIPLHSKKERLRGFNQSGEVGKLLTRKMNRGYLPNLLVRKIHTQTQANLSREERLINIKGAFAFNPIYKNLKLNSQILLFDDVYTTGSTMNEAELVLKKVGFKKIYKLVIAG
jgi:competence protein ComFC